MKLLTLNIEGDRHLERVCAVIAAHRPDVVCLQEVFETDCERLAAIGPYHVKYAVTTRMASATEDGAGGERNWGVAVLTKTLALHQSVAYYSDDRHIRVFREPNDARPVVIVTELEHRGRPYRIATTHFTWSADGEISDKQREDFSRLKQVLARFPGYVLCGDFNAPRGREMFAKFTSELGLADHLPADVSTTLDARFHYAGALQLAVDTIFSTPEYRVEGVEVLDGVSDHKAIVAKIERRDALSGE